MPRKKRVVDDQPKPRLMGGAAFVREMARRNMQLLGEMANAVEAGTLQLDDSPETDRYVENVISDWCSQEAPDLDAHMRMVGAVFLWALLDKAYGNDAVHETAHVTGADVALEALKTIAAIWGNKHG